jgi:hypothetical protein
MLPAALDDIEIRGLRIDQCKRKFVKPNIYKWTDVSSSFGAKEL